MYRAFTLPAGAALSAKVMYEIEEDWDYAYLVVSTDGGTTWTHLETSLSTDDQSRTAATSARASPARRAAPGST
jgi:bacillopeptidase F (M6 metalloprotease family)